ncbi:MAG: esterase family protein [Chloroflexi bacterium]|nr:MAG: esterase family protein [Chloroflexota bacterium]
MKRIFASLFLVLLWSCAPGPVPVSVATLPKDCQASGASGEIIRAELPQPARGYAYSYRVYLPPCFTAEAEDPYPVLYLVPGRSSAPDTWFNPGLAEIVDGLILSGEIPPFIIVTTENTDSEPMADTIHNELIPIVESQYPILDDRRYRAVAGGSLGGIAAYRLAFQYPDQFASVGIFGAGAISGEEARINDWLAAMTDANRTRVFMDTGDEDIFMLDRAQVMKAILDEAGIENQLHVGHGGHNYAYWVSNFEMYLKWMTKDW